MTAQRNNAVLSVLLLLSIALLGSILLFPASPFGYSQYDNTSIESRVNVTNAAPIVQQVRVYTESDGPGSNIVLSEGTTTHVICNATVLEPNGYQDFNTTHGTNATVWIDNPPTYNYTSADDNNYHYTNDSCTVTQYNLSVAWITCSFQLEYYASNDTRWQCNLTVQDLDGDGDANHSEDTIVDALFAINLTLNGTALDFGNMAPGDTTTDADEQLVNVTNTGNINISLSIDGYGDALDDGLAMNCTIGNISAHYLRYNVSNNIPWANMWNVSVNADPNPIPDFTINQRVDDADDPGYWNSTNTTWWKLYVPYGTKGFCNGTVIFTAME